MQTFKIWENTIQLEDVIKMKHLRKLMPVMKKYDAKEIEEIEMTVEASKIFFLTVNWETNISKFEEIMDEFTLAETTEFAEKMWEIITKASDPKKKVQKS